MNPELVKQISNLQNQVDGLIKPEVNIDIISPFLALPGLVGFWPMSSVQRSTGNVYDLSGQSRTLTYNGNPTFNYTGLVPYVDCDGTGDFLSRADETDLDIIGNEAIFAAGTKGLTLGGWFWIDAHPAANANLIGKGVPGSADNVYAIWLQPGSTTTVIFSAVGATVVGTGIAKTNATWQFIVARYIPSTSVTIWNGNTSATISTDVPASLNNTTGILSVMNTIDGRASLCFLCANALSDSIISALFSRTRAAFLI